MRNMQRAPLVLCCPTSQKMWWRVYVAYVMRGFWHVAFVGHQPNLRWVRTVDAERFVSSFRAPTLAGVAGDLKGIARKLHVNALKSSKLRVAVREKGNRRSFTAFLDGPVVLAVLARIRVRRGRYKERVISGVLGQLSAYLRLFDDLGVAGVPANQVEEFAMLPVHGDIRNLSLEEPTITVVQAIRAAGQ